MAKRSEAFPPAAAPAAILLLLLLAATSPPAASESKSVARDGASCTMCASCDNPCQPIYYPSPPPPPRIPETPSAPGTFYYYSPPPPSGGGGVYYPPLTGIYFKAPPPPNPFMPYFPFYYYSPPPPSNSATGATVASKSILFSASLLSLFLICSSKGNCSKKDANGEETEIVRHSRGFILEGS
ncbi:hypothetical protein ZIOFF_036728 [Zingiber officinale]|uniref:Uncharacterized protein n=1 Tax=Zingiber officinale TaxID=94328 RepID=A0A8J5GEW2_ZINOF|nr:hypothetical protein ZIOFF_036728 [Zingiber officinale]